MPRTCAPAASAAPAARRSFTGTVHMQQNHALTDDEVACGAILTCQSRPTTDEVTIDHDR